MHPKTIVEKIQKKDFNVGIVGLGYVGLPLLIRYADVGFKTTGFDVDSRKVHDLNEGRSYIEHIPTNVIGQTLEKGAVYTTELEKIEHCDAIIICVPTPLNKYREPDLSYVTATMDSLVPYLRKGQIISLESTTYPGTTDEELLPRAEKSGLKVGKDLFLVYSPEREDPGNANFTTHTIPKVCGGYTKDCLEVGLALYGAVIDKVVPVSSTRVAEMTKLLENIHRAINIGLVNEMKIVADRMNIDIHEVIDAAATKPFGFTPYYPGPGLGGHCIPIDPFYLTWKAREYGLHTRFIELAGEINSSMPDYVVEKTAAALNRNERSIKGASILVLGIAYKKNVDDMRESPSVFIMEKLRDMGAAIEYSDPHVRVFPKMREHFFELSSTEISKQNLEKFDCVILATDHDAFDFEFIRKNSKVVIDTRGVYREPYPNVFKS